MQNFIVVAIVRDWGWEDPFEHEELSKHPELYGPRIVEECIQARSEMEAYFRMKDRHTMCFVDLIEIRKTAMEFEYIKSPDENEEFYLFLFEGGVTRIE